MTADESRAVIDLWQRERVEQTGLTDRPAVPDVAEGLDIPVEEVQRLLGEVRARRLEEERALAQEQELSEIRLAEEERRLAEIRRQRAELRREDVAGRRKENGRVAVKQSNVSWQIPVILIVTLIVFWVGFVIYSSWIAPRGAGCVMTAPDGTTQPCGPEYYQAHPEAK